ncbi:cysteine--tRNA ligase [Pseudarthrobacter sp. J75]|uniref:cysteine--tRNA ligase n=1 Tax=unclassified Pseudarthrobacter TaxID=2647000 RepID=UPI002E813F3C|nr:MULTISPECIES: cysteine--tRNA ligase [unclassified Pseudarthrobacter]MEE2524659.1 cysteine--tRNA ligase [Pseudarthrobacter sp. J47]MEE2530683.1 cysteine--tRNA ligase [Pseudarthrobacter sp. J75]
MTLRFYDTASAEVRDFVPLVPGKASLYYCGATVQGKPHVGHIRSAVAFDQLTRWLEFRGHRVTVVRNVTDIDDKILAKSAQSFESGFQTGPGEVAQEEWWALAYRYEQEFLKAYDTLGVSRPTYEPRATGHIPEMHELIRLLIDRGHAYPALDDSGDVYFDVRSWDKYGSLTRQNIDDMQGAPDADPRGKRDPRDFALWKGYKEGEPTTARWDSPWGAGRPGWHLECSAMVTKYLGTEFDIHGGGLDLRFPHHENEMAQSQAAGHGFANFWMHNGMVTYQGEKMSKSIGNTISPDEMLQLASPRVVRYYLGQAHYRSILDYQPTSLQEAAAAVERIDGFLAKARGRLGSDFGFIAGQFGHSTEAFTAFCEAMDDDLNVPRALASIHETVRAGNTALADGDDEAASHARNALVIMTGVLGLDSTVDTNAGGSKEAAALDVLVEAQLESRAKARANKDWAASDAIRDTLKAAGIVVEDGQDGATWSLQRD